MARVYDPEESVRPGAWQAQMSGLQVDFDLMVAALSEGQTLPLKDQISTLLAIAGDKKNPRYGHYAVPNEIERLIAGCADGPRLSAMAVTQLARGAMIGAAGLEELAARIKAAEEAGKTEDLRAFVLALTALVHRRFVDRRSEREARSEIAMRLCKWGIGLLALAIALLLAGFVYNQVTADGLAPGAQGPLRPPTTMFEVMGKWHLTALIYFGFFGAFFSRLMAFQSHAGAMTWDDLHRGYRHELLIVRLMTGGFAALIFYYMIAGHIVGGDAFPSFADTPDKLGVFWYSAGVSGDGKGPIQYSVPSANFAKLVVWSFLAGFAEVFCPISCRCWKARPGRRPEGGRQRGLRGGFAPWGPAARGAGGLRGAAGFPAGFTPAAALRGAGVLRGLALAVPVGGSAASVIPSCSRSTLGRTSSTAPGSISFRRNGP